MRILREWIRRLWGTLRRGRSTADLEQELRTHLELAAEDARRRGLGPEQAIRTAQIETGGAAQVIRLGSASASPSVRFLCGSPLAKKDVTDDGKNLIRSLEARLNQPAT